MRIKIGEMVVKHIERTGKASLFDLMRAFPEFTERQLAHAGRNGVLKWKGQS